MPTIKEYNLKIKSLRNTKKITKTMKMVAASKLRRAQEAQANAKIYLENFVRLFNLISGSIERHIDPCLIPREKIRNVLVLTVTSDKGLCGAFNSNVNRKVLAWIDDNKTSYQRIDVSCCGKKSHVFFRKILNVRSFYRDATHQPSFSIAETIRRQISTLYNSKEYDSVYLAYNQFISPLIQKTVMEKLLPIDPGSLIKKDSQRQPPQGDQATTKPKLNYIFEPEPSELLESLLPQYLTFRIYFALLENAAGEHGARMTAMESATNNATEMIQSNTLLRNRARQAQITTELTEIISGAESLKN